MNRERQINTAGELEHLAGAIPEIIRQLRQGVSDPLAYALVYRLRWEIGLLARDMGQVGVPPLRFLKEAQDIMETQRHKP